MSQRCAPQRRPVSRGYYPAPEGGDEDMPPPPEEAWGNPVRGNGATRGIPGGRGPTSSVTATQPEDLLKAVLYTPACTMDELAKKLQVSCVIGPSARVAQAGFVSRWVGHLICLHTCIINCCAFPFV